MKKALVLLFPMLLFAQDIWKLFELVDKSPSYKAQKNLNESNFYSKKSSIFNQNYRVGADLTYAKSVDDRGKEYGVSAGRDFIFSKNLDRYLEKERSFTKLKNELVKTKLKAKIWRLYISYCINQEALQAKANLGNLYDDLVHYIEKGVKLGEFSRSDLEMAKLKRDRLNLQIVELDSYVNKLQADLEAIVPFDGNYQCYALRPNFNAIFYPENSILWRYMKRMKEAASSYVDFTQERINQIGLDLSYVKEIDTKRYTLSLSLPLGFGSSNEAKRLAARKRLDSIIEEFNALQNRYANETRALKIRIDLYQKRVRANEQDLLLRTKKLIDMKKAQIKAGESSLFELFGSIETRLDMIESILKLKSRRHDGVADYLERYGVDIEKCLKD